MSCFAEDPSESVSFLLRGQDFSEFVPIEFPGALSTQVIGINNAGHIVGAYVDQDGNKHGFLAIPSEPVPTVSEWGLIVIGLLLLIGATVILGFRRPALVGVSGAPFALEPPRPLFAAALFFRCLGLALTLLAVSLALAIRIEGSVSATDVTGSLITTLGATYLIHLLLLIRREGRQAEDF